MKKIPRNSLILVATAVLSAIFYRKYRKSLVDNAIITNYSDKTIYYKPEEGCTAQPIAPNSITKNLADGIATSKYPDKVYKITDGARAIVQKDGSVSIDLSRANRKQKAAYYMRAGWLDEAPDSCWDDLFVKALLISKI